MSPRLLAVCLAAALLLLACGGGAPSSGDQGSPPQLGQVESDLSSDCTGLVPASLPASRLDQFLIPTSATCLNGTADRSGKIALGWVSDANDASWLLRTHADAAGGATMTGHGMAPLLAMENGFQGLSFTPSPSETETIHAYTHSGTPVLDQPIPPAGSAHLWHVAVDYSGGDGSVIAHGSTSNTGNHFFNLYVSRLYANGTYNFADSFVDTMHFAPAWVLVGTTFARHTLVLWDGAVMGMGGQHVAARWFAVDGTPASPTFDAGSVPGIYGAQMDLRPTIGTGLVLQVAGQWVLSFPNYTTVTAAPSWLASRPNTKLEYIHGQRAYALLPFKGASATPCAQTIEVRAPAGNLCGTKTFTDGSASCSTGEIDLGRDGTVIQQAPSESCGAGHCSCTHRFWPAAFP